MSKSKIIGYDYEKESFLSKPEYGWVEFKPGNKVYNISYWVENLPIDWLNTAIDGMRRGNHFVVGGDQESNGPVYCVVPYENYCYVIEPCMDDKIEEFKCSRGEFCEILCNDLEKNIDEWAKWSADAYDELATEINEEGKEYNKKVIQRNKRMLLNKIKELRILLEDEPRLIVNETENEEIKVGFGDEDN